MPYGEGTYGSKVGRPKKKKRTTVQKGKMPKVKTDLKGTAVDKVISPTAKGLKKSGKAIKEIAKNIGKKANKAMKENQKVVGAAALGGIMGSAMATRDARKRSKNKRGPK
tara:strand:- start:84 stop:413 length:330 start_codon:yes stop_codon:yes gene_type:complete